MPNWCDNYIKIKGRSEEIIKCIEGMKGKKAIYEEEKEESLEEVYTFNATVEVPKEVLELGYAKSGYYWQKDNWGCKWDMLYESKYELDMILKELICDDKEENMTSNRSEFRVMHSENYYYAEDKSTQERVNLNKGNMKEVEFFVISPWSSVDEWVKALSDKHRGLEFELRFEISEEGFGGKMSFKAGELI